MISKEIIKTPLGYPDNPEVFKNSSLIISTAIGFLYHAAMSEENVKIRRVMLRNLMKIQSQKAKLQKAAGKLFLRCALRLIKHVKGLSINGPHPFSVLSELVKKVPIQIIVFKNNRIKRAFPHQIDLQRMRIALNESTKSYLPNEIEPFNQIQHLEFIKSPRRLFKMNYQCPLCLQFKTKNKVHKQCKRPACRHCGLLQVLFLSYPI